MILGTLLDVAEAEERTAPRAMELMHLVVSGMLTRFGLWLTTRTRDWIATTALGIGAAMSVGLVLSGTWMPWSRVLGPYTGRYIPEANPLLDFGIIIYTLWILGFIASLIPGQWKTGRAFMIVALVAPLVFAVINRPTHLYGPNDRTLVFFTIMAALVLLGTPRQKKVGYVASAAGVGIVFLWLANAKPAIGYIDDRRFWDALVSPDKLAIAIAIAAVAAVYLNVRYRTPRQIILILLIPWITVCGASFYLDDPMNGVRFAIAVAAGLILTESVYRGLIDTESGYFGRNRIGA
ncbi:hypothetical protein [Glaciihabitans tibetensis]|uniref:hypothetical protein n=1 Tax=Glaciihabitans tibetensis TaxID=1266600 RepID=UPI000D08244F|nr:hypothetical protein [Glaciihabitans tibetensis]